VKYYPSSGISDSKVRFEAFSKRVWALGFWLGMRADYDGRECAREERKISKSAVDGPYASTIQAGRGCARLLRGVIHI